MTIEITGESDPPDALQQDGVQMQDQASDTTVLITEAQVALGTACSTSPPARTTQTTPYYGLAIGFTVLAGAVAVGGISGGAFDPAVVLGRAAIGLFGWSTLIYLVPQLIAGVAAGLVFRALNPADG